MTNPPQALIVRIPVDVDPDWAVDDLQGCAADYLDTIIQQAEARNGPRGYRLGHSANSRCCTVWTEANFAADLTDLARAKMIISAAGKDGRAILPDLDGASPAGGLVTSESMPNLAIQPGDVIRTRGDWSIVISVHHNGATGLTSSMVFTMGGTLENRPSLPSDVSCERRTDVAIDRNTLYELVKLVS